MASAEFLEQALSTDVDENAVNAIVGSLENQLVTSVSAPSSHSNILNGVQSQLSNIVSGGNSIIGVQKYNTDQISGSGVVTGIQSAIVNSSGSYNNVQCVPSSYVSQTLTSNSGESLKVIYSQTQGLCNPSNRVTFPAQSIANGCILASGQAQLVQSVNKGVAMQPPLVIKPGSSGGQVSMQPGMVTVPMSVNSSMPGAISNVMTLNKPGGQNVVVTTQNLGSAQPTIMPNVQILNMRPGAPNVAAQKSVATVSPRVVIGAPQVVGARAAAPGITLQTLQSLQPGQQGHLLLKTETGQYQLLRVGPAPAPNSLAAPQAQTIRLSTVPAHPGVATVSTSMAQPGPMPQMPQGPVATPVVAPAPVNVAGAAPQPPTVTTQKPNDNTKEKCRNFLANLLDLSSKEPKSVEENVRNLIQELIDAQVEPEKFCDRLERLLNASPQPCLIGFLKRSLPLLRQSLVTKELVIEGINPPPAHVAFSTIPSLPTPPQPVLATPNVMAAPIIICELNNPFDSDGTILDTISNSQQQDLLDKPNISVSIDTRDILETENLKDSEVILSFEEQEDGKIFDNNHFEVEDLQVTDGKPYLAAKTKTADQVRKPTDYIRREAVIRIKYLENKKRMEMQILKTQLSDDDGSSSPVLTPLMPMAVPVFSPMPLGAVSVHSPFQLDEDSQSPTLTPLLPPVMPMTLVPPMSSPKPINVMPVQAPAPAQQQKPAPKPGSSIAVLQNIPVQTKINVGKVGKSMTVNSKANFARSGVPSAALSTVLTPGKSLLKDKEKKMQYSSQPFADDKMAGDDDINDVAAMGGVNLAEESQRILGSTELIGTQIRSCKDEYLVPTGPLHARLRAAAARHGLDEPALELAGLLSHAVHERLKNLAEKLAVIAQHRIDLYIKSDSRYEVTQDVKGQLKFLEELDRVDKKRREDSEREILLRAAKSRSKNEDPEQAKLKAKAKEMQRAELEELRQREANLTALQAIGPRKKPRLDGPGGAGDSGASAHGSGGITGRSQLALRTRLKRINHRDMIFLLEQERDTAHSTMLYRSYLK